MKLARKSPCSRARSGTGPTTQGDLPAWQRMRRVIDGYGAGILRIIAESFGREPVQRAWRAFNLADCGPFRGDDPNTELFFAWLFHRWSPRLGKGRNGITPTRAYLTCHGAGLDPLQRRYLEACLVTPFAFYEILDCKPHVGMWVRDILSGHDLAVSEGLASTTLKRGDIVFAHIVSIDAVALVEAISPVSFPPAVQAQLGRLRRVRERNRQADLQLRQLYFGFLAAYCPPSVPPELRNTAGAVIDGAALCLDIEPAAQPALDVPFRWRRIPRARTCSKRGRSSPAVNCGR